MGVTYDFASALAKVPTYQKKSDDVLQAQAQRGSNLAYKLQTDAAKRNQRMNEAQHLNNMTAISSANAGVDETLATNAAEAKKANALRSVSMGGSAASGLSSYLDQKTDQSLAGQKLNIAAQLANAVSSEFGNYDAKQDNYADELQTLAGAADQTTYDTLMGLVDAEDTRETAWNQNALNVANAIGSGEMTAADINARLKMEKDRIAESKYEANLPYNAMTLYQQGMLDLDTAKTYGQKAGTKQTKSASGVSQGGSISYANPNAGTGLRQYAEANGAKVGWDAKTGSVTVNNKTFTPDTLKVLGGYQDSGGTWIIPVSATQYLLR